MVCIILICIMLCVYMGPNSDPVKEYVRSGLGHEVPDPLTLRPPAVLVKTLEHLIRKSAINILLLVFMLPYMAMLNYCHIWLLMSSNNVMPLCVIYSITDRTDQPWFCVYDFVNNRIQSLRQDIVYQV